MIYNVGKFVAKDEKNRPKMQKLIPMRETWLGFMVSQRVLLTGELKNVAANDREPSHAAKRITNRFAIGLVHSYM